MTPERQLTATVRAAAMRAISPSVLRAIEELNSSPDTAAAKNLNLLRKSGAACLVAGQQLGLLLGPLFVFSKVYSLLEDAKALERQSGTPVVPVFWLQSEDHDLREITSIQLPAVDGSTRELRLEHQELSAPLRSIGALQLGPGIAPFLESVLSMLGGVLDSETETILRQAYQPEATFVSAFCTLLRHVFRNTGLLVFDPRHPLVRSCSAPVFASALEQHERISAALLEDAADSQVQVRKSSPLFFVHRGGSDAPRYRVDIHGESVSYPDGSFPLSELRSLVLSHPEQFSTSALLRPVLQQFLLPACGTVLGPSEVLYFGQLERVWRIFGVEKPLTIPRAEYFVIEPKSRRLMDHLKLDVAQVLTGPQKLREAVERTLLPDAERPTAIRHELRRDMDAIKQKIETRLRAADVSYPNALVRPFEKIDRAIESVFRRYTSAVELRESATYDRLHKLQLLLYPNEKPQERVYAFLPFWCKYQSQLSAAYTETFRPFERGPFAARMG